MPQRYTKHDEALVDPVAAHLLLELNEDPLIPRAPGGPGSSSETAKGPAVKIEFQFPPKLTTDSRRANWAEADLRGVEPVAELATSGPREMSLTWTYIIDSLLDPSSAGMKAWTPERIAKNVKTLRGYFALVRRNKNRENLVIKFKIWQLGGPEATSARIRSIDIKHGESLMGPPERAYYLRTDVTCDIRLWDKQAASKVNLKDKQIVQNLKRLKDETAAAWY